MQDPIRDQAEAPHRYPGTPGWVKVFGILILVLLLVFVLATILGLHTPGGPHGPGAHAPAATGGHHR